jgi:hypothetical protein
MDLLANLRTECEDGIITRAGYVLRACKLLQLDNPMSVDRRWLSDQLGMTYTATTNQLHRLKSKGLL